ncbi:transmembrane protein [Pelomyxa schiedti]|nr:transmembrane protein [Pelomyxa schiedti]
MISGSDGTCSCVSPTILVGNKCIDSTVANGLGDYSSDATCTVNYNSVKEDDSAKATSLAFVSDTFKQYQDGAVKLCTLEDEQYCQILGNLCVLQNYDETSSACAQYSLLATQRKPAPPGPNNIPYWPTGMPWLLYSNVIATDILTAPTIQMKVAFKNNSKSEFDLLYYLAQYSLEGEFLGFTPLTSQFLLCGSLDPSFFSYGTNQKIICKYDLSQYLNEASQTVFYDLYITDYGNSSLQPVPVLLMNYQRSGSYVNDDMSTAQLTRRFFMIDTLSGRNPINSAPQVIRFPREIKLEVTPRDGDPQYMNTPLLTLKYEERSSSVILSGQSTTELTVEIIYHDEGDTWQLLQLVLLIFGMVITGIWWIYRLVCWMRKNPGASVALLVQAVVLAMDTFANVFFFIMLGETAYMYVYYKGQSEVKFLLPMLQSGFYQFEVTLVIAWTGKALRILYLIYWHSSINIFFVDWEKSRGKVPIKGSNSPPVPVPVGVWRTLLAVNEWNRAQNARMVSPGLTLAILMCALLGLNGLYLAKPQPSREHSPGEVNPALGYTVCCFAWLIVALIQVIYHYTIRFRWFKDETTLFVDLLSVSNLSCFIFTDSSYGYYIHGKSVHAVCDTNMLGLNANLKAEKDSLTPKRGLVEGSDQQIFEIYPTPSFCADVQALYFYLVDMERTFGDRDSNFVVNRLSFRRSVPAAHLLQGYKALNAFFKLFISKTSTAHKYTVGPMRPLLLRLFGFPDAGSLTTTPETKFYPLNRDFNKLWLVGIEFDMIVFNSLMFLLVSWFLSYDIAIACVVCAGSDTLIVALRRWFVEKNLSYKTLIDPRFML